MLRLVVVAALGCTGCWYEVADVIEAETLASGENSPARIVHESGIVYWSSFDGIFRLDLGTRLRTQVINQSGVVPPFAIHTDAVFWAEGSKIHRNADTEILNEPSGGAVIDMAVDPPTAFHTDLQNVSLTNLDSHTTAACKDGTATFGRIAASPDVFTVVDAQGLRFVPRDGTAACDVETVPAGQPAAVVVAGGKVYWGGTELGSADETGGEVVRFPIAPAARDVAVDDSHIYWTAEDGTIKRLGKELLPSDQPRIVASNQTDPRGIALDDAHVYWVTGDGYVRRTAKP